MAAKRKPAPFTPITVYRPPPVHHAPAPIIRVQVPRPITAHTPKRVTKAKRVGRGGSKGGGQTLSKTCMGVAVGGAILGYVESHFAVQLALLPEPPLIGRKGLLAIAAYMAASKGMGGTVMRDVAIAASSVAGYELGKTGSITGE